MLQKMSVTEQKCSFSSRSSVFKTIINKKICDLQDMVHQLERPQGKGLNRQNLVNCPITHSSISFSLNFRENLPAIIQKALEKNTFWINQFELDVEAAPAGLNLLERLFIMCFPWQRNSLSGR